jgi:hypothetical protein
MSSGDEVSRGDDGEDMTPHFQPIIFTRRGDLFLHIYLTGVHVQKQNKAGKIRLKIRRICIGTDHPVVLAKSPKDCKEIVWFYSAV